MGEALQHQQLALHRHCSGRLAVLAGLHFPLASPDKNYCRVMQSILGRDIPHSLYLYGNDCSQIALYSVMVTYSIKFGKRHLQCAT